MAKTILLTCSDASSLRNFRGRLIGDLRALGHRVVAVAPEFSPAILDWLRSLGVATETMPLASQSLNPLRDLFTFVHLRRILRRHRPDVVMGYTHKAALYTAFAARLARVPRVTMMVTGLGYGFEPGEGRKARAVRAVTRALFRLGCAACDTVIFHNRDNRDLFVDEGLLKEADKAVVVGGSGVDLDHFAPLPLPPSAPGELVFLLVARIVRYKGILEYARAAEALRRRWPDARFLLAGYRDRNPLGYSESEWAFIETQLEFVGPADDVRPLYGRAHVYVLPSYGEGLPRTVLEAMACGRAVVTTETYGCRETVEEGVNGHLVPVRQWEPLATAMERFLDGRSDPAAMGAASLARARERFDVDKVNRDMLAALGIVEAGSEEGGGPAPSPPSAPAPRASG